MIVRFINKFQFLTLFILLLTFMGGCESETGDTSTETNQPDMHNSMIALDWSGTYHGVVPCADCEGIETKILLTDDLSYQLERIYLGKSDQIFLSEGTFFWSDDGSRIQLNNVDPSHAPGTYQVGENRLFQLDMDGNRIEGDLADRYVLTKVFDNLSGLHWELIELGGTKIDNNSETLRTPELHFISEENRISGNAGCNQYSGMYEIKSENGISFVEIASTKMACNQMEIENKFFNALERADNYTLNHDTLSLKQSEQVNLARFLLLDE